VATGLHHADFRGVGFGWRPSVRLVRVRLVKWFAPDAGNPSRTRYFTVPAALGNQYRENKKYHYDKT
jgi:hypothetical protein